MADEKKNGKVVGLEFDFERITARQIQSFYKAIQSLDMDTEAEVYAAVATSPPAEYADMKIDDMNAWLDLPWNVFKKIRQQFMSDFNATSKN